MMKSLLYTASTFLFLLFSTISDSTSFTTPKISIVDAENNTDIRFDDETHIIVSKDRRDSFELQCSASFPIMWAIESLEYPTVLGVKSERKVDDFTDESTYEYTMTVKLGLAITTELAEFECHSVDNITRSSKVGITWHNSCGDEVIVGNSSGEIISPGYPLAYFRNVDCVWKISVNSSQRIQLEITTFDMEVQDTTCYYEYLEIRNGLGEAATSLGRFCNRAVAHGHGLMKSAGQHVTLHFRTSNPGTNAGFRIKFTEIPLHCGGTMTGQSEGVITSPGYPFNYLSSLDCLWIISVNETSIIKIDFSSFQLEGSGCSYDYLQISDGLEGGPVLEKLCGHSLPSPVTSSSQHLTLKFHSDSSGSFSGFRLTYKAIPEYPAAARTLAESSSEAPTVIYWNVTEDQESSTITIPCFSEDGNGNESRVELYSFNPTDLGLVEIDNNSQLYFVPSSEGFLVNTSILGELEMYECRVFPVVNQINQTSTLTSALNHTEIVSEISSTNSSIIGSDEETEDDDYSYVLNVDTTLKSFASYQAKRFIVIRINSTMLTNITIIEEVDDQAENTSSSVSAGPGKTDSIKPFSSYLVKNSANLSISTSSTISFRTTTCCINQTIIDGFDIAGTAANSANNMYLDEQTCLEPLMCLTRKHMVKRRELPHYMNSGRVDSYLSPGCRQRKSETLELYNPSMYHCFLRKYPEQLLSTYYADGREATHFRGSFTPTSTQYEMAGSLHYGSDSSKYIVMTYESTNNLNKRGRKTTGDLNTAEEFYDSEVVSFGCKASPFIFARGLFWEFNWANGTSQLIRAEKSLLTVEYRHNAAKHHELNFTTDKVTKISCHAPSWNSSDWVTKTITVKLQASNPPTGVTGETTLFENVTWFTGQSALMECDFFGTPTPSLTWSLSHLMSTFKFNNSIYSNRYLYTTPSNIRNLTVSMSNAWTLYNINETVQPEEFTCSASSVAGYATKTFRLQPITSFVPQLAYKNEEVVVLFFNDEISQIDCEVIKAVPVPTFIWTKQGKNLSDFSNFEVKSEDLVSQIIFKKVDYTDEGSYECTARNFRGFTTKVFHVRVRDRVHSGFWKELILWIVIFLLLGLVTFIYIYKSRRISKLQLRAEYSKTMDRHESRVTIATRLDE